MKQESVSLNNDDFDLSTLMEESRKTVEEKTDARGMTAQQLNELVHHLVATRLVEALQDPERCTPGMLQVACRFLSDNQVTGLDVPEALGEAIRDKYKSKAPFKLAE